MPAAAAPTPPTFLQFGPDTTMIRVDDILSINREYLDITDERRERYRGFITPEGKASVIHLALRDGRASHQVSDPRVSGADLYVPESGVE